MYGSAKKKRSYKSAKTRAAAVARGKALADAAKEKAEKQLKGNKSKWEKLAKDWLKVAKGKQPKKTALVAKKTGVGKARKIVKQKGKTVKVKLTPMFQFLSAMKDKGASHQLAMYLWKMYSPGTAYEKKKDDKKKGKSKSTAKTHKKMTAAAIKKKAGTYAKSKVKGKYGKLVKQVGKDNAQKVVAESKKSAKPKSTAKPKSKKGSKAKTKTSNIRRKKTTSGQTVYFKIDRNGKQTRISKDKALRMMQRGRK